MTKQELIQRNKRFVLDVVRLISLMPGDRIHDAFSRQLIRCSSSVGANYRAACRAKSKADFINKLKIVEEEADESSYFLDLLYDIEEGKNKTEILRLLKEANELVSIYVSSLKTVRNRTS